MMAGIGGRNTTPEILLRRRLHAAGLRFRLHAADLPGKPDIVLPSRKIAIFVHGCFWHGHDCHLFRLPKTRTGFWSDKIEANRARDARNLAELADLGWRCFVVRECQLRDRSDRDVEKMITRLGKRIRRID